MVKPEAFESESLGSCSVNARWCFIGLLVNSDDFGHLRYQPNKLKRLIFMYDSMTVARFEKLINELATVDCIRFYEVDDEKYIDIPNFNVYQTINRPSKTTIPGPDGVIPSNTHGALSEHSVSTHAKERKKERRRKASKDAFSLKEEGAAVGAEAAKAAPPSAPRCPKCGGETEWTACSKPSAKGTKREWLCRQCHEEVWVDE